MQNNWRPMHAIGFSGFNWLIMKTSNCVYMTVLTAQYLLGINSLLSFS